MSSKLRITWIPRRFPQFLPYLLHARIKPRMINCLRCSVPELQLSRNCRTTFRRGEVVPAVAGNTMLSVQMHCGRKTACHMQRSHSKSQSHLDIAQATISPSEAETFPDLCEPCRSGFRQCKETYKSTLAPKRLRQDARWQ